MNIKNIYNEYSSLPCYIFTAPKGPSRYQETYFVFHLTPQQAQDIAMSRDVRATAKWEYTVQVQLRYAACITHLYCLV